MKAATSSRMIEPEEVQVQNPTEQTRPERAGWIEVIVGSMFSGKSEELIRRLRRAKIARQKIQVFKPEIDSRFSDNYIVTKYELILETTHTLTKAEHTKWIEA